MTENNTLRQELKKLEQLERNWKRKTLRGLERLNAAADYEQLLRPPSDFGLDEDDTKLYFLNAKRFCLKHHFPLPPWVEDYDLAVTEDILTKGDVSKLSFKKPRTKGGRHTSPRVQPRDRLKAMHIRAAVKLAELDGLKGVQKIDEALSVLNKVGIHCTNEAVRRAQGKAVPDFFVLNLKRHLVRQSKLPL